METKEKLKSMPDYLMQLMNHKKLFSCLPNFFRTFNHLKRLLDEEISRVAKDMHNDTLTGSPEKRSTELPDAVRPIVQLQEKLCTCKSTQVLILLGEFLDPEDLKLNSLKEKLDAK